MTTDAQRLANRKYYAKVRETRIQEMREKARVRQAEVRQNMMADPEYADAVRAKAVDKYYRSIVSKNRKRIEEWTSDPNISQTFKDFLRVCVTPVVTRLPKKFLDMCWEHLAIAVFPAELGPTVIVDAEGKEEEG